MKWFQGKSFEVTFFKSFPYRGFIEVRENLVHRPWRGLVEPSEVNNPPLPRFYRA